LIEMCQQRQASSNLGTNVTKGFTGERVTKRDGPTATIVMADARHPAGASLVGDDRPGGLPLGRSRAPTQARSSLFHRLADSIIVTSDWLRERRPPHHRGQQPHRSAGAFRPCAWQARICRFDCCMAASQRRISLSCHRICSTPLTRGLKIRAISAQIEFLGGTGWATSPLRTARRLIGRSPSCREGAPARPAARYRGHRTSSPRMTRAGHR